LDGEIEQRACLRNRFPESGPDAVLASEVPLMRQAPELNSP